MVGKKKKTEDSSMEKVSFYMEASLLDEYKELAKADMRDACPVPLWSAIEEAKKSLRPVDGVPVSQAVKEFLATKEGVGLSKRHLSDVRSRLERFANDHPNPLMFWTWRTFPRGSALMAASCR